MGKELKTAVAETTYSTDVECPHCCEEIDVNEVDSTLTAKQAFGDDNYNTEVECPFCEKSFIITRIEY